MADNVNIIVQDTINDIVVNAAVVVETIDINVQAAVDVVDIVANPNNYVVNINRIIGEQVQSDWDQTDNQAPDYIKNKPSIPAAQVNSDWDATTGVAEILNKPTIPAAQVNSDWNATSGLAQILNKPTFATVATSGSYNDLINKPTIPTATSDLTNDGSDGINPFITAADIPPVTGFVPYTGATSNVNLGTHTLSAKDLVINHSSGSGVAASITKGGAGEALTINKTSGSGNAMSVTGGVTQLDELHLTTDLADSYIASAVTWNGKFTLPALTSGSVLFSNGTTIAQDNSNLFWDDTNNRLGIGTATPTTTLDVNGTARVQNFLQVSQTLAVQGATNFPSSGSGVSLYYNNNGGNLIATSNFSTFATTQLCIQTGGGKLAINTGGATFTNTNNQFRQVGGAEFSLGGATQSFDFYVNGVSGNVSLNLIRPSNTVGHGLSYNIQARNSANTVVDYSAIGGSILTNTAGSHSGNLLLYTVSSATLSERMRIHANGNAGINTTTDAGFKLDVNGTARFSGQIETKNVSIASGSQVYFNGNCIIGGVGETIKIGASNTSTVGISIGSFSFANSNNTVTIGRTSKGNFTGIGTIVGASSQVSFTSGAGQSIAIGYQTAAIHRGCVVMNGAVSEARGQFVAGNAIYPIGNEDDPITEVYFGNGVQRGYLQNPSSQTILRSNGVGTSYSINGSGAFGTDFAGGNITIAGGKGTGTGTSGDVIFSTATPTTTGTTLQTLTQRWFIKGSSGILANVSTPNASAQLQVDSTTQGFLPPRMTTTQKNAISTPAAGLMVYDTTLNLISVYNGTMWISL